MTQTFESLDEADRLAHLRHVAERALPLWDLPSSTPMELLNISENATYRVDVEERSAPLILRVHRTGYHTINGVRTELAWMKALKAEAGVETPQAVPAADGELIKTVETPELGETRMVVMFEFIEGEEPDESALIEPFGRLGAVAARMHIHARGWQRPDYFERLTWDYEHSLGSSPNWGRWQDGMGLNDEIRELLQQVDDTVRQRLEAFGNGPDRFGLIHADLRLANLLETGNDTRVIDFDDTGIGWFLYDIATALSFMEARDDLADLINAWVDGYQTVAPLSPEEIAEIPTFLMLRRLLIIAWIGSHSDTDLAQELGVEFTAETVPVAKAYLAEFGPA